MMMMIIIRHKKTRNHPQYVLSCPTSGACSQRSRNHSSFPKLVFSQTGGCHTSPPLMGKLMINHINHEICWACPAFVFKPQQTHPITGSPCEPWIWPKEGDCGCDLHGLWLAILPWQDLLQLNSLTDYQMAGRSAVSTCTRWCLRQFSTPSHLQLWEVSGAVLFAYFEDSRCLSQSPSETFDVQVFCSWFIYIFIYILYVCYVLYIISISIYILELEWQMPQ